MSFDNQPMWKGTRVTTAQRRRRKYRVRSEHETDAKQAVRERDKGCRFPLCGCRSGLFTLKSIPTVSHDQHKGMGGDPSGDRSEASGMITLCKWRHQDAPVSRDRKTFRTFYLTPERSDGPLIFEVDLCALHPGRFAPGGPQWFEVAREVSRGVLAPLTDEQIAVLDELAEMVR